MKVNRKKLKLAMARACMDNADLVSVAGIPRPTVTRVVAGKEIRPSTLGCVAKALGVDPAEIMEDE